MHIELWRGRGKKPWRWKFKGENGKTTDVAQGFPSRAHAMRACKTVVRGVRSAWPGTPTYFTAKPLPDGKRTIIRRT